MPVYLDYNATTPVDPRVVEAMLPHLESRFGNPSSAHPYGQQAKQALDAARAQIARLIGSAPGEIVFTGCATEANNLALLGVARALGARKRHLITDAAEHPSVLNPLLRLRDEGFELTILPVDGTGGVNPDDVASRMRPDTALVSIMHANNETGTTQPIAEIAAIAHAQGALMHSDASQSAGKIPVDVDCLGVDLLTLAGHKFYAPKGVGALYVRRATPIVSPMAGADQEGGLRPGTESVPLIVGMGVAASLAKKSLPEEGIRLRTLRGLLHSRIADGVPGLMLNGSGQSTLPNTLNISFPGITGWRLLETAQSVAASTGSACHASGHSGSPVLIAMGLSPERLSGAVRLSLGRYTTEHEIERAADGLVTAWRTLARP